MKCQALGTRSLRRLRQRDGHWRCKHAHERAESDGSHCGELVWGTTAAQGAGFTLLRSEPIALSSTTSERLGDDYSGSRTADRL